jgi:hypothetical protein
MFPILSSRPPAWGCPCPVQYPTGSQSPFSRAATDLYSRLIAEPLEAAQPERGGQRHCRANTIIGARAAVRSPSDGFVPSHHHVGLVNSRSQPSRCPTTGQDLAPITACPRHGAYWPRRAATAAKDSHLIGPFAKRPVTWPGIARDIQDRSQARSGATCSTFRKQGDVQRSPM